MKVRNEKVLGGLGGIGIALSFLPFIGTLIGVVGYILFLMTVYDISRVYKDDKIFKWSLMGVILSTVGLFLILLFGVGLGFLSSSNLGYKPSLGIGGQIAILFGVAVYIYAYFFIYKALKSISEYVNVSLFKIAGIFLFAGSILTVIVIGVLVNLIGWLLVGISFFRLPEEYPLAKQE
jgi:uncharacterized membrane protein